MPSSGFGNSHDSSYRTCQRKFYYAHRLGIFAPGQLAAPPLVIGEAIHKYAEVLIGAWIAGQRDKETVMAEALGEYDLMVPRWTEEDDTDPTKLALLERDALARAVLPLWGLRKWARLDSGIEVPIAVEQHLSLTLPALTKYGPIREELRTYTARLDYIYQDTCERINVIVDHKGSKALSPESEARHYLQSDQHLGYVYLWNAAHPEDEAEKLEYSMIRLHAKVTSEHTFHEAERRVDCGAQLDDWYERMLYLRAELTYKWDMAPEAWLSNTAPHGPCLGMDGRACEYLALCKRPDGRDLLMLTKYVKENPNG